MKLTRAIISPCGFLIAKCFSCNSCYFLYPKRSNTSAQYKPPFISIAVLGSKPFGGQVVNILVLRAGCVLKSSGRPTTHRTRSGSLQKPEYEVQAAEGAGRGRPRFGPPRTVQSNKVNQLGVAQVATVNGK